MTVPSICYEELWEAVTPVIPFDPALALVRFWLDGAYRQLGSPLGPEHQGTDGAIYQTFACGIARWHPSTGATIV